MKPETTKSIIVLAISFLCLIYVFIPERPREPKECEECEEAKKNFTSKEPAEHAHE